MSSEEFWALTARFDVTTPLELFWVAVGLFGQVMFFMRFFIQWIASERRKQSVVPLAFWYFSVAGGTILLVYAIYKADIVFILGQAGGLAIYMRNLMLIYAHRAHAPPLSASEDGGPDGR
jgi:lipid-A-disaccharide synthase-like uncharacterized protein